MDLQTIINGCKENDRKCQDALVRQFAPKLMAVCRRYCKDTNLAQDALQETFINILKYIKGFKNEGSFEGWMRRIAVNCCFKFLKKIRPVHFQDEAVLVDVSGELPDVYSQFGKEELMSLVKRLPPSQHLVFNMKVVEGYSHKEIGEILNITPSTARANLTRAKIKLIQMMEEAALVKINSL